MACGGDGGPHCPPCYVWNSSLGQCVYNCNYSSCQGCIDGKCKSVCDSGYCEESCNGLGICVRCGGDPNEACCNGECCPEGLACCNGQCYDKRTKQCCEEGICDLADCKSCVDGQCESWCDSDDCESCVDGERKVCGDDPTKCCINGECVDKCGGDGDCCPSGLSCCGKQCYNPSTQKCCEGFATTSVCPKTQACCPSGECCNSDHCQGCNPESGTCDDLCEQCQECIAGYCLPCAVLDKICCDGWCEQPCEEHMENDCNPSNDTDCLKCIGGEAGCGPPKRVYTGYHTTTCSGGCFGDCHDVNDEVCYTEYRCKLDGIESSSICLDPNGDGCTPAMEFHCATCEMDSKDPGTPRYSTQAACQ